MGVGEVHAHGEGVEEADGEGEPVCGVQPVGSRGGRGASGEAPDDEGGEDEGDGEPLIFGESPCAARLGFSAVGFFDEAGESGKGEVESGDECYGGGGCPEPEEDGSDEEVEGDGVEWRSVEGDAGVGA